jgi:hypothetical protein
MPKHERVKFKLLQMPCCGHLLCWINPRPPNYCPECGSHIFGNVNNRMVAFDDEAMLTYKGAA